MGGGDGFKMFRYNDQGILCIIFRNLVCVCVCVGGGAGSPYLSLLMISPVLNFLGILQ